MQSIKLNTRIGRDGMLQLQIPVGVSDTEMEVIVIYQPTATADSSKPNVRSIEQPEEMESGWADEPIGQPKPSTTEIREDMW